MGTDARTRIMANIMSDDYQRDQELREIRDIVNHSPSEWVPMRDDEEPTQDSFEPPRSPRLVLLTFVFLLAVLGSIFGSIVWGWRQ